MKEPKPPTPPPRRRYEPPEMKTIKVRLEEVALMACKTSGGGGAPSASCVLGCPISGS